MTHFIIPHSDRLRVDYSTKKATCVFPNGSSKNVCCSVLGDNLDGNVDPLVLGHPWYYSFCQGNLVHKHLNTGSVLFFCSSEAAAASPSLLKIDTVFVIEDVIRWTPTISHYCKSSPNDWERDVFELTYNNIIQQIRKKNPCPISKMNRTLSLFKKFQLIYGFKNKSLTQGPGGLLQTNFDVEGHRGRFTYVAKMWKKGLKNDEKYSFLTKKDDGKFKWPKSIPTIKKRASYSLPVSLNWGQMNFLYNLFSQSAKIVEIKNTSVIQIFS